MPDAMPARDAVRRACDLNSELTRILTDTLIILDVEARSPSVTPDSAGWIARAQSQLTDALRRYDAVREAIQAAQPVIAELAEETGRAEVPGG